MLGWANQFNICCFLDDHQYHSGDNTFECLLAVNAKTYVSAGFPNAFSRLETFLKTNDDWCFGHLGYDLKNETEIVTSGNPDYILFPDLFFFVPEIIIILRQKELLIGVEDQTHTLVATAISQSAVPLFHSGNAINIQSRFTRDEYIETIHKLQQHILYGDCYEINFCQEFYNAEAVIDPLKVYLSLSRESPNPFSSFYRVNDNYLLCASPERYLRKKGQSLISQPIKGTIRRNAGNIEADLASRKLLLQNAKERSENIMIVDLVRNDLAKICKEGSVKVDELLGVYAFPQVYQMISTISGELPADIDLTGIFKATFPMGSMTGAPKKRVMELIEKYEKTKRGLFSGALGYISPERDFDFNVVIRSILYNSCNRYLSFQTGSAITFKSKAEDEYEECLLKAAAIKKVLGS